MFDVKGIDPAIKSLNVFKKFFLEYDYTHSFTKIKAKIGGQYASFRTTVYLTWPFCPESATNTYCDKLLFPLFSFIGVNHDTLWICLKIRAKSIWSLKRRNKLCSWLQSNFILLCKLIVYKSIFLSVLKNCSLKHFNEDASK